MTKEEAIEILEERWRYSKTYKYTDAKIREAFEMAIKALSAEPCEDCISREAYIERFRKWAYSEYGHKMDDGALAIRVAMSLPSVTPQPKMGRWIMDSYSNVCECSECAYVIDKSRRRAYCPMCGAKMESEE